MRITLPNMKTNIPSDLITAREAREVLQVSTFKMAQIFKQNIFRVFPDPLDQRKKLVSKADVLALKTSSPKKEVA